MENLLLSKLHGPAERGFSYLVGYNALVDALKLYEHNPKYQRLEIDFEKGENPDDAYSRVPYEKGSNFILHIGEQMSDVVLLPKTDKRYGNRTDCWRAGRVLTLCV